MRKSDTFYFDMPPYSKLCYPRLVDAFLSERSEVRGQGSEVEVLVPLVEHVHPLRVVHPFPLHQPLALQAAVDAVEDRPEHDQHAQQTQLRDGVVVDEAGDQDAESYPCLQAGGNAGKAKWYV